MFLWCPACPGHHINLSFKVLISDYSRDFPRFQVAQPFPTTLPFSLWAAYRSDIIWAHRPMPAGGSLQEHPDADIETASPRARHEGETEIGNAMSTPPTFTRKSEPMCSHLSETQHWERITPGEIRQWKGSPAQDPMGERTNAKEKQYLLCTTREKKNVQSLSKLLQQYMSSHIY